MAKDNVIFNRRSKKDTRRKLRKSGTAPEAVLWTHLQRKQILGKLFRRQVGIGRYIVDFYCPENRLVVELDGDAHFSTTIEGYESERTQFFNGLGLTIVRFENRDLLENLDGVLEAIKNACDRQSA